MTTKKKSKTPRPAIAPAVRCSFTKMLPLGDFLPNPNNPNKHDDRQLRLLGKAIQAQGWRKAIVVSNRSGMVVEGHGRLAAAHLIGCTEAPADFQDFDSDEQETAHLLADNRLAGLASLDAQLARALEASLSETGFDLELTGLDLSAVVTGGELKDVAPLPLPATTWFLLALPTVDLIQVQKHIDKIAACPQVWMRSTANDKDPKTGKPIKPATPPAASVKITHV